jgi:transposase
VTGELAAAGITAHLAGPADTAALRGRKRHPETGKAGARHLRAHLLAGDLPGSWIPPQHVLEARATVRLYKDLVDERGAWHQRVAATVFHQGVPAALSVAKRQGRAAAAEADLSPAGRQAVDTALRQIDRLTAELDPLRRQLEMYSRRQGGCAALRAAHFGIGAVTSVAIWAELGDVRRFTSSDNVVRHTGLDITVHSSDIKRPPGKLSRQGPPLLRWALYEAAKSASAPPRRTTATTPQPGTAATAGWPPCRWPASWPAAATTPCASSARRHWPPRHDLTGPAPAAPHDPMNLRPAPAMTLLPGPALGSLHRTSGRTPSRGHPITHLVAGAVTQRSAHPDKTGRPARRGPAIPPNPARSVPMT